VMLCLRRPKTVSTMREPSHPFMPEVRKLIAQRGPRLAILGPPGTGKSRLLNSVAMYLAAKGIRGIPCKCIQMDLRNLILGTDSDMYSQLRDMFVSSAEGCGIQIARGVSFQASLEEASRKTEGYLVLALDHLDDVPYRFAAEVAQHLRRLKEMSEGGIVPANVGLIVSGCVSVFKLRRQSQSGLAQTASFTLPRSNVRDQEKLVRATVNGTVKLSAEVIRLLARETGGDPAFLNPLMERLCKRGGEVCTTEHIKVLIESIPFQESVYLRRVMLSVLYDPELAAISLSLAEGRQRLVEVASPDIDPYQLGGAVIADHRGSYQPRNGIVCGFVKNLHAAMQGKLADPPHPLVAEMIELRCIPEQIGRGQDVWAATPLLLRAWEIATCYSQRPRIHLTASAAGAETKWLELSSSFGDEGEKPRPPATEAADSNARKTGRAVLDSDAEFLAFAVPARWKDMSASLLVTAPRGESQWTESALQHWAAFAECTLPELLRHALTHWGKRYVASHVDAPANGCSHDVFLSFASANRKEADEIKKSADEMGVRLFISSTDLETGSAFSDQIREALTNSHEVWLLATPDAINSVWVQTEWGGAWALKKPILPIMFRLSADKLPDRLAALQVIDYHEFPRELKRLSRGRAA